MVADGLLIDRIHLAAALAIDGKKHRVPAAGPAEGGGGALYAGMTFGHFGIIRRGDGTFLGAKCFRRIAPDVLGVFRIAAALRRQWIRRAQQPCIVADDVRDGLQTNVACHAVANTIARAKCGADVGALAVIIVTETQ